VLFPEYKKCFLIVAILGVRLLKMWRIRPLIAKKMFRFWELTGCVRQWRPRVKKLGRLYGCQQRTEHPQQHKGAELIHVENAIPGGITFCNKFVQLAEQRLELVKILESLEISRLNRRLWFPPATRIAVGIRRLFAMRSTGLWVHRQIELFAGVYEEDKTVKHFIDCLRTIVNRF